MRGQGTPVAASSASDVGQAPGTCGAVHGALQAPETDCYREIVDRLNGACIGHPMARIPWPHRVLHDARDAIARLHADNTRLRAGIQAFLDGNYPNPRTLAGGSATYQCLHGAYRYEDCGQCDGEYLTGLLK